MVKIVSNNICFGPMPSPDDEVEQHLIISDDGKVIFTAYKYGNGYEEYDICREQRLVIDKSLALEILDLFLQYKNNGGINYFVTDIGLWEMIMTDTDNNTHHFDGSLCGGVMVGDIDLTKYLRERIPIDRLFVFGPS